MRRILVAGLLCTAFAVAMPSSASAWTHCGTPQAESDCPPITTCLNGVETSVPDNGQYTPGECPPPKDVTVCSNGQTITVPENQVPEGSTPGECVVPPVETPPAVVVPPPPAVEDVPPVDTTPDIVQPVAPKVDHHNGKPNQVEGKEQQKPNHDIGTPVSAKSTGTTLPFTGLSLLSLVFGGLALSLTGFAGYRALRT